MSYKKFSRRNYFYGLPVLFSRRKKKDLLSILHKIRHRKDPSSHVDINSIFSTSWSRSLPCEVVCVTHDKVPLKRLNWPIDKLSCKTLFELLILYLFQFYPLKNMVEMYKIKRLVGNNNNCAIIHSSIITWDMHQSELTENSLSATLFTGHL